MNGTCSTTCGSGTISWTREKKVEKSNGGTCDESLGSGTEECYDCMEIGKNFKLQPSIKRKNILLF